MAIHCNRWSVERNTSHVISHAPCTCDHTHIVAQGVSGAHSFHVHAIHDVTCLSVRCWSSFCLLPLYLSLLLFLFHCLPVLCPVTAEGLKPLHSRTMRSIAPWRYTIPARPADEEPTPTSTVCAWPCLEVARVRRTEDSGTSTQVLRRWKNSRSGTSGERRHECHMSGQHCDGKRASGDIR